MSRRQVVLDTETTGLEVGKGHRVVEIGCIELVDRRPTGRRFHRHLDPERDLDPGAAEVNGLTRDFLAGKPLFATIAEEFIEFIRGAELIIHNADFDVGFLDNELSMAGASVARLGDCATITDTLAMARERFPGKRNSLDALCSRLDIDNAHRTLHGALLDAELLAEVYLAMSAGQGDLGLAATPMQPDRARVAAMVATIVHRRPADAIERAQHAQALARIEQRSGAPCLWRVVEPVEAQEDAALAAVTVNSA